MFISRAISDAELIIARKSDLLSHILEQESKGHCHKFFVVSHTIVRE